MEAGNSTRSDVKAVQNKIAQLREYPARSMELPTNAGTQHGIPSTMFLRQDDTSRVDVAIPLGTARIARWKNDKSAAFCLMFDDSIPSDVATVFPELTKRKLIGDYYVNPGGFGWKKDLDAWEKKLPASPYVVYANHTFTHNGARSVAELAAEVKQCNDAIYKVFPGKRPRLIAFGRPGVPAEKWTVTEDELKVILRENNLVERPPFGDHGAMIGAKTPEQMVKMADAAINSRGMGFIVFHGVGGDWIVTPTPIFVQFLDLLETRRKNLWITDYLSVHRYETAREATKIRTIHADTNQITLQLQSSVDRRLYDMPLTVVARIPDRWTRCAISQRGVSAMLLSQVGMIRFDVLPDAGNIIIRPVK